MAILNVVVTSKNMAVKDSEGYFTPFDLTIKVQNRDQAIMLHDVLTQGMAGHTDLIGDIYERTADDAPVGGEDCYQLDMVDVYKDMDDKIM